MDKASERRKDAKACGDTDIGVHDYGAGGKREQLEGLWDYAGKEVTGMDMNRLVTNCYSKGEKKEKVDLIEQIAQSGPPLTNTSKPHRIF